MEILKVENLTKIYKGENEVVALNNVSFSVKKGDTLITGILL